jgi:two-component system chemotaxis sensor kinase CheA
MVTTATDEEIAAAVEVAPSAVQRLALLPVDELVPASGLPLPADDLAPTSDSEPTRRGFVRVDVVRLDDAMDQLSALIVTRSRLSRAVAELKAAGVGVRELSEIVKDNTRQLRDLRAAILRVRMVLVSDVLDRVPLIVRGLRRESGKLVRLSLDVGNTELDKAVAERIFPAIVHLVRNAVDHALETPAERIRAGKPEEGVVSITCAAHSNTRIELTVTDDGRGVDRASVALHSGGALGQSDAALLDAICLAGLTTRAEASTTSGRGMGMDIVKRIVVDELGGELFMKTEPGKGTSFTLRVPLTIAIVDAFVVECAGQQFIVPVSAVEEILEIDHERTRFAPSRNELQGGAPVRIIQRRSETVPLLDLASLLRLPTVAERPRQALVVRRGGEPVAFAVHRVLGQQEAVVRPLVDQLVQVPGVSGAADLGSGRPTLVLDLGSLVSSRAALGREVAA